MYLQVQFGRNVADIFQFLRNVKKRGARGRLHMDKCDDLNPVLLSLSASSKDTIKGKVSMHDSAERRKRSRGHVRLLKEDSHRQFLKHWQQGREAVPDGEVFINILPP
jgi:hypothetical protein